MQFHRGRLLDHLHLRAGDLVASKRFYRAVLSPVDRAGAIGESATHMAAAELWIDAAGEDPASRVHLAFQAPDRETVDRLHGASLETGGRDDGGPGEHGCHPGCYAAFALDPDGDNVDAVYRGPAERSADSVVLTARRSG